MSIRAALRDGFFLIALEILKALNPKSKTLRPKPKKHGVFWSRLQPRIREGVVHATDQPRFPPCQLPWRTLWSPSRHLAPSVLFQRVLGIGWIGGNFLHL